MMITIAIPTFNRADTVEKAIYSALAQSGATHEIIVSDNASTDDTVLRVQNIRDDRIKLLQSDVNIGMVANWNKCLAAAQGNYFLLLSDDDEIKPDFLQQCVRQMTLKGIAPEIIYSDIELISIAGTSLLSKNNVPDIESGDDFIVNWFSGCRVLYLCGVLFKTSTLKKIGGFPNSPKIMADSAAIAATALYGNVLHIQGFLAKYNFHSENISSTTKLTAWIEDDYDLWKYVTQVAPQPVKSKLDSVLYKRFICTAFGRITDPNLGITNRFAKAAQIFLFALKRFGWFVLLQMIFSRGGCLLFLPSAVILKLRQLKNKY